MKNSIGTSVQLTLFGESHGPAVGGVLDGLAPGVRVDESYIARCLSRRRPSGVTDTARAEKDDYQILSGVYNGYTTGTPITIVIPNENTKSSDYAASAHIARPSHADLCAQLKYHGFQDVRGGGHFSGRVTAAIVALGAICRSALSTKGIELSSHILRCGGVKDKGFSVVDETALKSEIRLLEEVDFPVIDESVKEAMQSEILSARREGDSVGGIVQTAVASFPAGVGEPWFDSVEGELSKAMFSIGGVKGVSFGLGFGLSELRGSQANDAFRMGEGGRIVSTSNNNGGVLGGISTGMPIVFDMAVKPTPSISIKQQSVDLVELTDVNLEIKGRHDPAILRRICPVVSAMTAVVLCDLLSRRFGTDFLCEEKKKI